MSQSNLKKARKWDERRMDWLEQRMKNDRFATCFSLGENKGVIVRAQDGKDIPGKTLRQAVDRAMMYEHLECR